MLHLHGPLLRAHASSPAPRSRLGEAPGLPLGVRAALWSMAQFEQGAGEKPPGSNGGPDIAGYFAGTLRRGTEAPTGLKDGNWCAAGASAATMAVLAPGERAPHGWRAAAVEIEDDAKAAGLWHPAAEVRAGGYVPRPGDLAIYDRSNPGDPSSSWWRHVNRILSFDPASGHYATIGANERDGWNLSDDSNIDNPKLLGVVGYPQDLAPYAGPMPQNTRLLAYPLDGVTGGGAAGSSSDDLPLWLLLLVAAAYGLGKYVLRW